MKKYNYIGFILILFLICSSCVHKEYITKSGLSSKDFISKIDNQKTGLYTITNKNGIEVCITNYGARIVSIMTPDKNGKYADIVCGFDSVGKYHAKRQNFGATIGRYISRIRNARFSIDSITYHVESNGNQHCMHGGYPGFADKIWKKVKLDKNSVQLSYLSKDGENGFPGNLNVKLTYAINDDNALTITYQATTDKATVLNLSNHSFFNLTGDLHQNVLKEYLWVEADSIAEYDSEKCMSGRFLAVKGTPFDFKTARPIGEKINNDNEQLKITGGYDHTWRLNKPGNIHRMVTKIVDKESGRTMEIYTEEPGMHIYTANGLRGVLIGKQNIAYPTRAAICFETMHFSDSPNLPQFPTTLLRPGQIFHSQTIYKFGIINKK